MPAPPWTSAQRDYEEYYNRFSNSTLWPLFHYRVDLVNFERGNYTGYRRVNRQFARSLAGLLRPDDLIWVHDYHLIPLGEELRRLGVRNRLGLFLHTPLPPRELMATLPVHKELMRCFSFFDLVGFQTETDRSSPSRLSGSRGECPSGRARGKMPSSARSGGSSGSETHPIGIDTRYVERNAARAESSREFERLRVSLAGRRLIVGVDRLDYSKGLPYSASKRSHISCGPIPVTSTASP